MLWTLFFGGLATLLAVSGPLTFVRQILRKWGIWLLALAGAGLGIPLLLILLDEPENAFADIHSAAVSSGMLLRMKVEHLALAIGLVCTLIACFAPLAQYQNFLLLIGSVFAPLFGVVGATLPALLLAGLLQAILGRAVSGEQASVQA